MPLTQTQTKWQIQDAKNKFSQVVKAAASGVAQWVTVHGKPMAVVVSAAEYSKLQEATRPKLSLNEALLCPGLISDEEQMVFERDRTLQSHREWMP
jgi:prevent-host-death family protein